MGRTANRLIRWFVALSMVMGLAGILATPVSAGPAVDLSPAYGVMDPDTGSVETIVTVKSDGVKVWPVADQVLIIYFDDEVVPTAPSVVKTASDKTYLATFKVPEAKKGAHTVKVTDGVNTATATFTVTGKVAVSPTKGPVGTSVTVKGTGYTAGVGVDIFFAGEKVASTTTDGKGSFTATFTVPTKPKGTYTVSATDGAGYTGATATFEVTGKITLTPTSGKVGTVVTITGSQFTANTTTKIFIAGAEWTDTIPTTDAEGKFETTRKVPSISPGTKLVEAKTGAGLGYPTVEATATFTVEALPLTLTPTSGVVDTKVTISGTGFTVGETANITVDTTSWGSATVVSGGIFTVTLTYTDNLPLAAGAYTVKATGSQSGVIAEAKFTLAERKITLSPTSGRGGITVTVSGSGFRANGTVDIKFAGDKVVTASTDSAGNFSASFTQPKYIAGTYTVRAEDPVKWNDIYATATFKVPAAELSLSPTSGPVGSSLTISGIGFPRYASVTTLAIAGSNLLPPTGIVTDSAGNFTHVATVPDIPLGVQIVTAIVDTVTVTAQFTVTAVPVTVADVMAPISAKLVRVWGWDAATQAWKLYDPVVPVPSEIALATLEKGKGYWIKVAEDTTLIYRGNVYSLKAGWNLIGWLG